MQRSFSSCEGLTEIDPSGLGPSSLEGLAYSFGRRGSLTPHVPEGWTRRRATEEPTHQSSGKKISST